VGPRSSAFKVVVNKFMLYVTMGEGGHNVFYRHISSSFNHLLYNSTTFVILIVQVFIRIFIVRPFSYLRPSVFNKT